MTEKEKMRAGKIYDASDVEAYAAILRTLVPKTAKSAYLQGPVQFDYGLFTELGENCYANFNLPILDCAPVKIGRQRKPAGDENGV